MLIIKNKYNTNVFLYLEFSALESARVIKGLLEWRESSVMGTVFSSEQKTAKYDLAMLFSSG